MDNNSETEEYKLELVHVLFRHGDRTPDKAEIFNEEPGTACDFKPFGFGQLTNIGKKRAFRLGEVLRERYGSFLGEYDPENIYAYSTHMARCKVSLQLVLAGLCPPTPELTWNDDLKWNPMPFFSNPGDREIFYSHVRAPTFRALFNQAFQSPVIKEEIKKYDKLLDHLVERTGCPREFQVLSQLYQNVQSKKEFGLDFPSWCDENIHKKLKRAHEIIFAMYTHNDDLKSLIMGPFLKKVISNIKEHEKQINNTKMYLFSAHDLTVHAFLRSHNINDIKVINYCGTAIIEKLRGKDGQLYIRLLYWPGEGDQFETLKFKDCEDVCPYLDYLERIYPILP